jgi:hypothetical protein
MAPSHLLDTTSPGSPCQRRDGANVMIFLLLSVSHKSSFLIRWFNTIEKAFANGAY